MSSKKIAELSSGLVATKGSAAPPADMPVRSSKAETAAGESNNVPLNFRVPPEFRREFKTFAAQHDMKLNALLQASFEEYRRRHS